MLVNNRGVMLSGPLLPEHLRTRGPAAAPSDKAVARLVPAVGRSRRLKRQPTLDGVAVGRVPSRVPTAKLAFATGDAKRAATVVRKTVDGFGGRVSLKRHNGAQVPRVRPLTGGATRGLAAAAALLLPGPVHHNVAAGDAVEDALGPTAPDRPVAWDGGEVYRRLSGGLTVSPVLGIFYG